MSGKCDARIIDHAFVYRRGHHRRKFAGHAAIHGAIEQVEHMAGIGRIETAGHRRCGQGKMQHIKRIRKQWRKWVLRRPVAQSYCQAEMPGALGKQPAIPQNKEAERRLRAKTLGQAQA